MARYWFGGGVADWAFSAVTVSSTPNLAQATGGSVITFWSAETGGSQYTDLLDSDGAPVMSIMSSDGTGVRAVGQVPPFQGPDNVVEMWASANGGPRSRMLAMETPSGAQAKADAAQATAIAAIAGTGPLRAVDGRHYRMVLGVIRNNGSPNYWQTIDDASHRPHNIDSVTTDAAKIVVDFSSLGGIRVVSLGVFPDETLAAAGIMAGASVTAGAATITLSRPAALGDYVFYNGTSWVSQNGVFTGLSFAAGVLSMSHASMEDTFNPFVTHYGVSVTGRGSALVPMISTDSGGVASTGLKVSWFDWAGTLQTTANANMKAFITRSAPKAQTLNPQAVDTTKFPSSNLWIIGVVEV